LARSSPFFSSFFCSFPYPFSSLVDPPGVIVFSPRGLLELIFSLTNPRALCPGARGSRGQGIMILTTIIFLFPHKSGPIFCVDMPSVSDQSLIRRAITYSLLTQSLACRLDLFPLASKSSLPFLTWPTTPSGPLPYFTTRFTQGFLFAIFMPNLFFHSMIKRPFAPSTIDAVL